MSRSFSLSSLAEDDLEEIHFYGYTSFGKKQAIKYLDGIVDAVNLLAINPYRRHRY